MGYKNAEGYSDPTAGAAIGAVMKEYRRKQRNAERRKKKKAEKQSAEKKS